MNYPYSYFGVFKSNWTYWEELLKNGSLYSHLKDGVPITFGQHCVGYAYPFIMVLLLAIGIIGAIKTPREIWRWKTFTPVMIISMILGWSWNIWMLKTDPVFPGWLNTPWAVTGLEFIMTLEDWLFYPGCAVVFYLVFRSVKLKGTPWTSKRGHYLIIFIYSAMLLYALIFSGIAGRSESLMFGIPGVLFYMYAMDRIDIKKFLVFQVFLVTFECLWDWFAVSWLHYIPGMSWASEWIYLTFDSAGNYYHSKIFIDYGTHHWAWIFMNPIEITPWFGITGGIFNYGIFSAADKLFYQVAKIESKSK